MTERPPWRTRPERPSDAAAIRRVTLVAFGQDDEADLVDALREDSAWIDGLSVVATDDEGTVVGHALLTRCHIDDVTVLCLAPCSVLPAHQGMGAGTAAIRTVLDAARDRGEGTVVVLGHPTYYPRFGFTRASSVGIHLAVDVPDEAVLALSLASGATPPVGTVRYAAPFGL